MTRARDLSEIVNSTGLSVDTDTLVVDSANNRVGIGTDLGSRRLNVFSDTDRYTMDLRNESGYNSGELSGIVFSGRYDSSNSVTDMASIGGGKENTSDGNFGGRLSFFTRVHNGIDTERLRIDSSGQVKITDGGSLNFDAAANGNYDIAYKSADNTFNIISNSSSAVMGFHTNSTERMRIDSGGTTTIKTDGSTQLVLNRADASIQNGNQIANLLVTGDDPSAGQSGAAISFIAGDAWATNSYPTNITFSNDLSGTLTERMRIDASGNVGIGTSSLTQKFEVIQGAGATTRAVIGGGAQAMLVINGDRDNSGDSGLEDASLVFASDGVYDGTGNPNFGYRIGHANASASNALIFTGIKSEVDYERMRVDSSGNLLVGKTSTSIDTAGHTIFASGEVFHTVAGTPLYVNRTGSDGSIQNFYKDGSSVGSIGANSGTPYMSGNLGGFRLTSSSGAGVMVPTDTDGNASDADNDLGVSSARWRDLYLSGSVVHTFDVVNNGTTDYQFSDAGSNWFPTAENDPVLYLRRGETYIFSVVASGHPFQIRVSNGGAAYNTGVTNNGADNGDVVFKVPMSAPPTLYYQCTVHSGMGNTINIV